MVKTNGVARGFDFRHPLTGTTIADTFTASYDFARQPEQDHILLEERDGDALLRTEETTDTLTYYFPGQIRMMLAAAGFEVFHEQGSLVEDIPICETGGEMVVFCRKVTGLFCASLQTDGYEAGRSRRSLPLLSETTQDGGNVDEALAGMRGSVAVSGRLERTTGRLGLVDFNGQAKDPNIDSFKVSKPSSW